MSSSALTPTADLATWSERRPISCSPGLDITIRPSGTEPKAKIYVDLRGDEFGVAADRGAVRELAQQFATATAELCLERVGIRLSASAQRLPDFIDVDLKQSFDEA